MKIVRIVENYYVNPDQITYLKAVPTDQKFKVDIQFVNGEELTLNMSTEQFKTLVEALQETHDQRQIEG